MKIGILGTGFGAKHLSIYHEMSEVDEIFVFGRNMEKLLQLKEQYNVNITTDVMEVICNPEIELIDVCLPTAIHCEYVIKALEHGKHVFCETPIAFSVEEAERMQEASIKSGKKLMVDLFLRFEIPYAMAADFAAKKTYGSVKRVQIHRNTAAIWGDLSLPYIVDALMMHDIDYVSWMLSKPEKIQVSTVSGREGESAVTALLSYKDAYAEITSSAMMPENYPFTMAFEVIYEKAVVSFSHSFSYPEDGWKITVFADGKSEIIPIDIEESYIRCIRYTLQILSSNETPIHDVSQAIQALKIAKDINKEMTEVTVNAN